MNVEGGRGCIRLAKEEVAIGSVWAVSELQVYGRRVNSEQNHWRREIHPQGMFNTRNLKKSTNRNC